MLLRYLCVQHAQQNPGKIRKNSGKSNKIMSNPFFIRVNGRGLEVLRIPGGCGDKSELVFLHEGLGSISLWKDFPARVAAATGSPVTVYSRYGSGNSDPLAAPHTVRYMHDEALRDLPQVLTQLNVANPILIGHSDGASIAIIYAGANRDHKGPPVRGLVLLAPHVFVENLSLASISEARLRFETTNMCEKLGRHHRDPARTFWGWNNVWLHPGFRQWNIEEYLPRITCPILAIQGLDDEYGTMAQVEAIKRQSCGTVEILTLADCRHSAHRDQADATLQAITSFVRTCGSDTLVRRL
jgi:pimeloyl-ACP methyl ester carboxylesterase